MNNKENICMMDDINTSAEAMTTCHRALAEGNLRNSEGDNPWRVAGPKSITPIEPSIEADT